MLKINDLIFPIKDALENEGEWEVGNEEVQNATVRLLNNALRELQRAQKILDAHQMLEIELGQINGI